MAKKVIFNDKVNGNTHNLLVGNVGEKVFALTKSVKEMNDAIRWCREHNAGEKFDKNLYSIEIISE